MAGLEGAFRARRERADAADLLQVGRGDALVIHRLDLSLGIH